jgi:hypothetical protein
LITPALQWNIGDLPAQSSPFTITITTTVETGVPVGTFLHNTARISYSSSEREWWNNLVEAVIYIGWEMFLPFAHRSLH